MCISCLFPLYLWPVFAYTCRRRWKDNIKTDVKEMECEFVEGISVVWDWELAAFCEQDNEISASVEGWYFLHHLSHCQFYSRALSN